MKLKTKVSLILIFLVIAVCSLFAACKIGGKSWEEILGDARHQYITYYAGGGTFGDTSKTSKDIYYPADTSIMTDVEENTSISVKWTNWLFKGWYYVELDKDGNPVFASEEDKKAGIPKLSDEEVPSNLTLKKDQHLYFGAKWTKDYKLKYFLYDDPLDDSDASRITVDEKVYKSGDELTSRNFGKYDAITVNYANFPLKSSDATLLEYYVKNESGGYEVLDGTSIKKPAVYDDTVEDPYVGVYCKFISDIWNMVRTPADVLSMFEGIAYGNSYYVTQDIDCTLNRSQALNQGSITGTIEGNGHVISNQKFQLDRIPNGTTCSIFGQISNEAVIKDITFTNFEATVSIRSSATVSIYLFSHGIEEDATLENVAFKDSTLSIPSIPNSSRVRNIQTETGYQTETWICGIGDYSGAEFDQLMLKIENQTIIVK